MNIKYTLFPPTLQFFLTHCHCIMNAAWKDVLILRA